MTARFLTSACVLFALVICPAAAAAQAGRIQLDHLNRLAAKAAETVDVTVDSAMLKQSAVFLAGRGGDHPKLQELIEGIRGIYVKSFKFEAPGAYSDADVDAVRKQVAHAPWARIVGVREKGELTEIYLSKERNENGGLVVIAAEADELTIVNIVGRVDLASLAALGPMIPSLKK